MHIPHSQREHIIRIRIHTQRTIVDCAADSGEASLNAAGVQIVVGGASAFVVATSVGCLSGG
eukprot:scaffold786_cov91-Skeletonema_dohrnii-CCMP3373.AAC.1